MNGRPSCVLGVGTSINDAKEAALPSHLLILVTPIPLLYHEIGICIGPDLILVFFQNVINEHYFV